MLEMHGVQVELDERLEELQTVTSPQEIAEVTRRTADVLIDPKLLELYQPDWCGRRGNGRSSIWARRRGRESRLMQGARTLAAFRGRDYAVPDDVVELALPVAAPSRDPVGRGGGRGPRR